jgi:hypothetical protein
LKVEFSKPVRCQIAVQGRVPPGWLGRLGSLELCESTQDVSVLEGCLRDQAELFGVLATLHDLHCALVSVECVAEVNRDD